VAAIACLVAGRTPKAAAATASTKIWRADYWATKQRGDTKISLAMYRKRLGAPAAGQAARPVLFLVHGSSSSSQPSFDLTVPGHPDYSLMDAFARLGFDVWTMDHEGYGRSTQTDGNSDIASGVADLAAASEIVGRETGMKKIHYMGESSGALRAAAFAAAHPDRVDRLILEAFTYTGQGSPTLGKRAEQAEYYKTHHRRPRDAAMLRSIFTRDKPGTTDPAVAEAFVAAEMPYGNSVPSGTYLDMTTNLPVVDPAALHCPVLLIKGEYDGIASTDDLLNFFRLLPTGDKQFVIVPGAAHSIILGTQRRAFWHVANAFLTMPVPNRKAALPSKGERQD
jgi:pimeloyl-ACP methyl ester carboxylesterase